jgi:hypothetical protein
MKYLLAIIFIAVPPLRPVDVGPVVSDIESHLPAGHPYYDSDRITWVHEGTHGINSRLRNLYGCPAFYVLKNRAVLLNEPDTTLAKVARRVPKSLRGSVYSLYLIQMQGYWNQQPSYVFDEWVAYTNGAEARRQLGITSRGETVDYALEFCIYAACVPWAANSDDPKLKAFYKWQVERVLRFNPHGLDKLKTAQDAESLRQFLRSYCGSTWTKKNLGF